MATRSHPRAALRVAGLTVRFGSVVALEDVDLELPAGAKIAVLGPNGCGKTTLLNAALGIVRPSHGTIALSSKRVAYVSQRLDIEPMFPATVTDIVRMGRYGDLGWWRRFGERDRRLVGDAIRALELEDIAGDRFATLSGGQRQRALLAQAMAQDADILLLDEPYSGVDLPAKQVVARLIDAWRHSGSTVIVTTHDLVSAMRDYDIVVCLNRSVVAVGPPAEVVDEDVLSRTFRGRLLRIGDILFDADHHHEDAG